MKMPRVILFLFGLCFLFVNNASAGCAVERCVGKITTIYPHSIPNTVYIGTDGDETALFCIPNSNQYIKLSPGQTLFKEMYDLLIMGMMYNRTMQVRVNTDGTSCRVVYVLMQ